MQDVVWPKFGNYIGCDIAIYISCLPMLAFNISYLGSDRYYHLVVFGLSHFFKSLTLKSKCAIEMMMLFMFDINSDGLINVQRIQDLFFVDP